MKSSARGELRSCGSATFAVLLSIAVLGMCGRGVAQATTEGTSPPRFEVSTIRISHSDAAGPSFSPPSSLTFTAQNILLKGLICAAFHVSDKQVQGLPEWADSVRYDLVAKPSGDKPLVDQQRNEALRTLLVERFHLMTHTEKSGARGYELVLAKAGPKLKPSQGGPETRVFISANGLRAPDTTLEKLAPSLQFLVGGAPVVDATGIKGNFEIELHFANDDDHDSPLPTIFTALQEQVGLKLISKQVPIDMIVVDHVDPAPTEN
jgi:uncharacterized protein (TIGR03435 family)